MRDRTLRKEIKMKKWMAVLFVVLFAMLAVNCKSIFGPSDDPIPVDKYINVDVLYNRVNDGLNTCPMLYPNKGVVLSGFWGKNKEMTKIGDSVYQIRAESIRVNYPDGEFYDIYTLDSAFYTEVNQSCYCKARGLSFNGYRVPDDKVRTREGGKQYVLVRFSENGTPYFY